MPLTVQIARHGGAEEMQLVDLPVGEPGPGQIRIRHHAIGLNFIDVYQRSGLYQLPMPLNLGMEGAGIVEAVGEGVTHLKVGDRAAYASNPPGSYSEERVMPALAVCKLPDEISFETGAAMMLKGLTAHYLLRKTLPAEGLQPGDFVLWHAAAGGVGLLACQWARALGARLIGVVSSPAKAALALQHGAWAVIDRSCEDVRERVLELTNGQKCPVVYDSVGQASWSTSLDCLQPRGLLVSFGNASGPVEGVNLGLLAQKGSLYVTRPSLFHYANSPTALQQMADELFGLVASGQLHLQASQRLALRDAAQAHRLLQSGQSTGSLVLLP